MNTAKRMAMNRMMANDETLPPLIWEDFEHALERTQSEGVRVESVQQI